MSDDEFPQTLRAFISRNIATVEQLEILCVLISRSGETLTAPNVFKSVQSSIASVSQGLEKFTDAGFLTKLPGPPPTYQLNFASDSREILRSICRLYSERPVQVITAIYQQTRSPAQGFADAFKFKDPEQQS